jgi:hypothetical protein
MVPDSRFQHLPDRAALRLIPALVAIHRSGSRPDSPDSLPLLPGNHTPARDLLESADSRNLPRQAVRTQRNRPRSAVLLQVDDAPYPADRDRGYRTAAPQAQNSHSRSSWITHHSGYRCGGHRSAR